MSNEPDNTLELLTPEDIHPTKAEFPFVRLLVLDDLLKELNQRARTYKYWSFNTHECQQQALTDFAQQIEADGRTFIPFPEVDQNDPVAKYFEAVAP